MDINEEWVIGKVFDDVEGMIRHRDRAQRFDRRSETLPEFTLVMLIEDPETDLYNLAILCKVYI